jgi:tetratricopeptide (TPR) repeat protein
MAELHERLQGKITDLNLTRFSAGNLGSAYSRMGQVKRAITFYEKALQLARGLEDRWGEGVWLGNLGLCISDLGDKERGNRYLEEALAIRIEVGDLDGESADLTNLAENYSAIGQNTRAIDYCERALRIVQDIETQEGESLCLDNLGIYYRLLGQSDEALRYHTEARVMARDIGYRYIESMACGHIAELLIFENRWSEAPRELELAIEIADNIGASQISKGARETLALVHVYENHPDKARELIEAAQKYDIPLMNHATSAMLGVVALRQGDRNTAREAFTTAINQADQLIALSADWYDALDAKALSHCGLALCGDRAQTSAAEAAYKAARAVTSDAGVTRAVLHRFDALAQADTDSILADVRSVAAGMRSE